MKRATIACTVFMCAVVSGSLWGCRETNQREPDAGLKIITESISVSAEGGEAVIEFTIDEAVESEAIIVHPRDGWVHSPEIFMPNVNSTDGKIVLTVDANTGSDLRATEVEVMYNNTEDLSNVVSIIQGGEPSGFEISVTDITTYSVVASIIPVDKELTYFASLIAKDDYSEFNNDQELFDYNYNLWVENFPSIEDFLANGLQQGDLKDTVTSLLQDTEYFIYAYGVDNATGEVLTSLYKAEFKSEAVCKIDMSIGINVTVDGNNAEVTYTPSDNTVPYFNSITTKSDLEEYGGNIEEQVGEFINEFIGFLLGFTPYDFFEYMSDYGEKTYSRSSMEVESDYIAFAVAWDGGCNMISNVFSNEFRTEDIHPSDNEITLKVWSPGSRSVFYEVQTTNEDPYVIRWLNSEEVENMTNQEIFEYLLEIYPPDDYFNSLDNYSFSGNYRNVRDIDLEPNSKYCVVAFGYSKGIMTTAMQKVDFKTAAEGEITASNMDYFYKIETYPELCTAVVGVYPQEVGIMFYPGLTLGSKNEEEIKKDIAEAAAENGKSVPDYLKDNSYDAMYVKVFDSESGIIMDTEYKVFAVGVTSDGEYAQDFVFSEPFVITSGGSSAYCSNGLQVNCDYSGTDGIDRSIPMNSREDVKVKFNKYLRK